MLLRSYACPFYNECTYLNSLVNYLSFVDTDTGGFIYGSVICEYEKNVRINQFPDADHGVVVSFGNPNHERQTITGVP